MKRKTKNNHQAWLYSLILSYSILKKKSVSLFFVFCLFFWFVCLFVCFCFCFCFDSFFLSCKQHVMAASQVRCWLYYKIGKWPNPLRYIFSFYLRICTRFVTSFFSLLPPIIFLFFSSFSL